ncbi:MAG: magnesium transporter CorA family protein [Acidobacteria bacterium]|nr:magnesium transporter CorA family protein [Acidobacteriota bacterium]
MEWHDLRDPNDPLLDELAARYQLHPLHIEDCRHRGQNAKVEESGNYLFVVLKPVAIESDGSLTFSDLDLFLGRDFLITVQESACEPVRQILDRVCAGNQRARPDQLLYRIADGVVDGYLPALDLVDDVSDALEAEVLEQPSPQALDKIFSAKRNLIELRRVLANTRDVAGHLQRTDSELIARDLWPFLRDVYDHVARNLDTVEVQRDVLSGLLEIYLSSVAQRTNMVVKVLTVLSTIALPAVIISSFYGMNLHGLPWGDNPHGAWIAIAQMAVSTLILLGLLRLFRWL